MSFLFTFLNWFNEIIVIDILSFFLSFSFFSAIARKKSILLHIVTIFEENDDDDDDDQGEMYAKQKCSHCKCSAIYLQINYLLQLKATCSLMIMFFRVDAWNVSKINSLRRLIAFFFAVSKIKRIYTFNTSVRKREREKERNRKKTPNFHRNRVVLNHHFIWIVNSINVKFYFTTLNLFVFLACSKTFNQSHSITFKTITSAQIKFISH